MSDTLSEAERLLNTIVSSRVRLASLRGEPGQTPEPAVDAESFPTASEITFDSMSQQASEPEPSPSPAPEPTPETSAGAAHAFDRDETDAAYAFDRDEADAPRPRVLGIPSDEDEVEIENPLLDDPFLGFSAEEEFGHHTDLPLEDPMPIETAEVSTESPDRADEADEADPFSFIDLIPNEPIPADEASNDGPVEPQSTPPPVRPKPLMPLPTAMAAGAPSAAPATTQSGSAEREMTDAAEPTELEELQVIESTPAYGLSSPRAVTPQLLDPERERLEVEVYEEEDSTEAWDSEPPSEAPRLTEVRAQRSAAPLAALASQDEAIFDAISGAQDAIRRGALREAHDLLSDALDWDPHLSLIHI